MAGLALCLLGGGVAAQQADGAAHFVLPEGLAVRQVAASPLLYNPTALDVDARGRLWVTEAVNYRRWDGRNAGHALPGGDRVVILEDTDGDGDFDTSKVFVQERGLVSPLGIAVLGNQVWVSCSPDLIVYTDRDGDDVPDERRVVLTGFGGRDHDHGLHSLVAGPDGRRYLAVGNAGPHLVTDSAGWSLRSGSLYTGGGQFTADNKPGLISDDARVWTGGLALRMEPDGSGLAVVAHNFRNNYEVALDSFGNLFQSDNDDDGNQACRFLWCLEGGNHGYFAPDGSRSWTADRRPGQDTQSAHWHQDDPGVVPAGAITGAGGPTGVTVYEGALLAPWIDGNLLATDAGAGVLYAFDVTPDGAGFALDTRVLLGTPDDDASRDARWFRPSDVVVDRDGSLLVADWFDPGVGGHAMGDTETYGRILRIEPADAVLADAAPADAAPADAAPADAAPADAALGAPRYAGAMPPAEARTLEDALALLNGPAIHPRVAGWVALSARLFDPATEAATLERLSLQARGDDPRARARALWLLATAGEPGRRMVQTALADPDPQVRVAAFRALRRQWEASPDHATTREPMRFTSLLIGDRSPAVRREVALSLRDVDWLHCATLLTTLCQQLDPDDRYAVEALGLGAEGKQAQLFERLASEASAHAGQPDTPLPGRDWDARLARLAWRLHPVEAVPGLADRASAAALPRDDRLLALDALAFVPDRAAADAMLQLALAGPEDTREAASWWLQFRMTNDWRDHGLAAALAPSGVQTAEVVWRSELVRRGGVDVDVDIAGSRVLWLVADDAGNGNACDWVDWLRPRLVGPPGEDLAELDLVAAEWLEAEAAWGSVQRGLDCEGGALGVGGVETTDGIGTHAPSHIGFVVPPGYTRFTARAAVDDTGTAQDNAPTSVHFEVRVERAPALERLLVLRDALLDVTLDEDARADAALALAEDAEGAALVLALAADGRLDAAVTDAGLRAELAQTLFRHPDFAVRALAGEHFTRTGAAGVPLPPPDALLALPGDPVRGREVFFAANTQCSACHALTRDGVRRGGEIGPELTTIRQKYGRPALLDAILNPSAGIAFGYDSSTWEQADGRVASGFLLSADDEQLVIKDTRGRRQVLDATAIVARRQNTLSTMPDGLATGMAAQDLADLLAFLTEDAEAPLPRGEPVQLLGADSVMRDGVLPGWTHHLSAPGTPAAAVWSVADGVLSCEGQPVGYLRTTERFTNFELELDWRFDPERGAGNSGVLLRVVGDDVVWPKSIEVQLQSGNAGDLWNIGEFGMAADPGRTSGRNTARQAPSSELPLGQWNHYRITLDRGRLEVVVNGVVQNSAAWCDEVPGYIALQSEGAPIQFRNIVLTPLLRQH